MRQRLLFFICTLIFGCLLLIGLYYLIPTLINHKLYSTSDASRIKGKITIGVDSWVGYYPLCSKKMRSELRAEGYVLECVDDQSNYPERMQNLKQKKLDFAVASVDAYLLNGLKENFPATIVAVVDESKGGDVIIARKKKIKSIEDLKKNKKYKLAYTPQSPSEQLLRAIISHFDVPRDTFIEEHTDGAESAFKKLLRGTVDAAIVWEPFASQLLSSSDFLKILSTEDTEKLIVDVLLANRDLQVDDSDKISIFISKYFKTLQYYTLYPERLKKEIEDETKAASRNVESMLKGVSWISLYENAVSWFGLDSTSGIKEEGLYSTIESSIGILLNTRAFDKNPLPNNDPYMLINSAYIKALFNSAKQQSSFFEKKGFAPLAEDRWDNLKVVGTLKIRPITFQSGSDILSERGIEQLNIAIQNLKHYPNFRVYVKGYTGLNGNPNTNLDLSDRRAKMVKDYLVSALEVDSNRIMSKGFGSKDPLPRKENESLRSYNYRLSRVELFLVDEIY